MTECPPPHSSTRIVPPLVDTGTPDLHRLFDAANGDLLKTHIEDAQSCDSRTGR